MYIVMNRIDVGPDQAEGFETHFAASMRSTLNGVPGLRRTSLLRPVGPNQPYLSTMEFDSQDDFLAWMRSDSFRAAHANVDAPGMQAPSGVEQYTAIEDIVF